MQEDKLHSIDADHLKHDEFRPMMDKFVDFVSDKLKISKLPTFTYKKLDSSKVTSFGGYDPAKKEIVISTKDRHPMDVFRTVAHELVHHKQNEEGRINNPAKEAETGSPIEDEANFMAGRLMRWYGKANPGYFKLPYVVENTAIFVVGGPCCGKDKVIKELREQYDYDELDIQALNKVNEITDSVIINASADKYDDIIKAKELLEYNDYNVSMIFVDVSDDISRMRNEQRAARGQKVLNEGVRSAKYFEAKKNLDSFVEQFDDVFVVDNTETLTEGRCWKGYRPVKGKTAFSKGSCVKVSENLHQWFQSRSPKTGARGWVQVGGKYDGYPCARQKGQTSTPKCRSSEERSKMSKKEKNYAFKKKNREDPNQPQKSGGAKPTMVKTYKEENEHEMARNQLRTAMAGIQKLLKHTQGKGELEDWVQSKITKASDYIDSVADYLGSQDSEVKEAKKLVNEVKDACYHKVKSRYKVFPSAYASGALVKCRKKGADNWGTKSEETFKSKLKDVREVKGSGSGLGAELRAIDKDFASYMAEEHGAGFFGTTALRKKYEEDTPGQGQHNEENCGCEHEQEKKKAKKIMRKKLTQEDGILDNAAGTVGLISGTEAGPGNYYSYSKVPGLMTGLGTGYSFPFGTLGESVANWFNNPKTQERFRNKYGNLAEQKLIEAAQKLDKVEKKVKVKGRKPFSKIKEGLGLGYSDMAQIPGSKWKDEQPGSINEAQNRYGDHAKLVASIVNKHRKEHQPEATETNLPYAYKRAEVNYILRKELENPGKLHHVPILKKILNIKSVVPRAMDEDWSDVKHQDPRGGLKPSGVRAYRREHPGSKLKTAVREKPSQLKKGGKRWKRRKSFCSRMKGMKAKLTSAKTARDPNSRINKSLRAWNCEE